MKPPILVVALLALALTLGCNSKPPQADGSTSTIDSAAQQISARPAHWGYDQEDGPTEWAMLSPVYALCASGKTQSPINIERIDAKGGATWKLDYKTTSLRIAHNEHMEDIIDNGHTIQITVDEGSTFTFGEKSYNLKQFHFHTPSEHTLDGKHAPMEMHLVHQSADGSLAVIGVLFQEGQVANENFKKIIANLPNAKGESKHVADANLELKVHLPKDNYAYHYTGSLTTPPCTEGVQWLVLRDPVLLTADQIKAFSSRIGHSNRPTQPVNDRTIKVDNLAGNVQ